MKTHRIFFILALCLGVGLGFGFWSRAESPLPNETLTDLSLHPMDPSRLLVTSEKELYLREGKNWKRLLSLPGNSMVIQHIVLHPFFTEKIFLLSPEGVLEGNLKTRQTRWLFRERNPEKNSVFALTFHPDQPHWLYLGTARGLYQSHDGGQNWQRPLHWPENQSIRFVDFLASDPATLFIGTARELFFSKNGGKSFESGFSLALFSGEDEDRDEFLEDSNERAYSRFTSLAHSQDFSRIWVGTLEGTFESRDGGIQWAKLPEAGLERRQIVDLVFSESAQTLFAATAKGVFRFHSAGRWEKLPVKMTKPPSSLALQTDSHNKEILLVASGAEVIEWPLGPVENPGASPLFIPSPERMELFRKFLMSEPGIREIQKQAIRYGNLGNGKIQRWQWGSRMRAFIPHLTFSKDFSYSQNVDIDRGGTNDPDRFIHGPDESDSNWDVGLTWELGDLLYSSAQTSIDSRAKLLVELRESILSEVTRIYFERRKLQMELIFSPPEMTFQERLDLLLRLEELTAQLDALTDGFLSERLGEIEQTHPEFKELFS